MKLKDSSKNTESEQRFLAYNQQPAYVIAAVDKEMKNKEAAT